jgi:integrase
MNGHIRELSPGRYLVRISAGRDVLTGCRRQPSRVIRGTKRDAEVALARLIIEQSESGVASADLTLGELFSRWQESPKRNGQRRAYTSLYHDRNRFNRYVAPGFGTRVANTISGGEIARLYDELLMRAELSPRSVLHIHSILRAMYEWGSRRELVSSNPLKRVVPPSVQLRAPHVPERDTVVAHLARLSSKDLVLKLVVGLASVYGLRRSELAGLRWENVDLMERRIRIVVGVTRVPSFGTHVTATKTGHQGFAEFALDSGIGRDLEELYVRYATLRAAAGIESTVVGYVFGPDPMVDAPCSPDTLSQLLRRHCAENSDLPSINLKCLRAFTYTTLSESGVSSATASAVLRDRPETTARHYLAARKSHVDEAVISLGEFLYR